MDLVDVHAGRIVVELEASRKRPHHGAQHRTHAERGAIRCPHEVESTGHDRPGRAASGGGPVAQGVNADAAVGLSHALHRLGRTLPRAARRRAWRSPECRRSPSRSAPASSQAGCSETSSPARSTSLAVPDPIVVATGQGVAAFNLADVFVLTGILSLTAALVAAAIQNRDSLRPPRAWERPLRRRS